MYNFYKYDACSINLVGNASTSNTVNNLYQTSDKVCLESKNTDTSGEDRTSKILPPTSEMTDRVKADDEKLKKEKEAAEAANKAYM
jgi:hypothetical protein